MLTGDEVGALLAWWIAERGRRSGSPATGVYAQSIVSGTLLERIANAARLEQIRCLTEPRHNEIGTGLEHHLVLVHRHHAPILLKPNRRA